MTTLWCTAGRTRLSSSTSADWWALWNLKCCGKTDGIHAGSCPLVARAQSINARAAGARRTERTECLIDLLVMLCGSLWAYKVTCVPAELAASYFARPESVDLETRIEVSTIARLHPGQDMLDTPRNALNRWSSKASEFERDWGHTIPAEWKELGILAVHLLSHCRSCMSGGRSDERHATTSASTSSSDWATIFTDGSRSVRRNALSDSFDLSAPSRDCRTFPTCPTVTRRRVNANVNRGAVGATTTGTHPRLIGLGELGDS
jgi:hypothetical protein